MLIKNLSDLASFFLSIKDKNLDNMLLGQNHEKKKKDANRGADKTLNSRRNLKQ